MIPRYYVDTSVFGGCFDLEFRDESTRLFEQVRRGKLTLLLSPPLLTELSGAPAAVQALLPGLPPEQVERISASTESEALRDAYLRAEVVAPKWSEDAHHVALATIARSDLIVSWNFKHLVNVARIRGFNAVNLRLGYPTVDIRSPKEVFADDP